MQEPPPEPPEQPTQPLPVPQLPQLLQAPQSPTRRDQYISGIGWGCIPLVLSLIAGGVSANGNSSHPGADVGLGLILLLAALIGYLVLIIVMIVNLVRKRRRFIGYGMLTLVLITPVVSVYGCQVLVNAIYH